MVRNETILLFSDTHFPYTHNGFFEFIKGVKKKHKPNKVYHLGDMIDNHAISYHEKVVEILDPVHELEDTIEMVGKLGKIFPKMTILTGNHDVLQLRKARTIGLHSRFIRNNKEVFNMPKGWEWSIEENIMMNDGRNLLLKHNLKKDALDVAKYYNTCYVQGHYHTESKLEQLQDRTYDVFGATLGCFIDNESMAMEYNKGNMRKPQYSCMIIINGRPKLIFMEDGK